MAFLLRRLELSTYLESSIPFSSCRSKSLSSPLSVPSVMSSFKIRAKTSSGWIISTSVLYICRRRHDCHALSKLKSYLYMLHLSVIAKTRYVIGEIQVLFVLQVLKQLPKSDHFFCGVEIDLWSRNLLEIS